MQEPIRNRIKGHRRVRAGDLIPHELNFRLHPDLQKSALRALYQQVGFARSLLPISLKARSTIRRNCEWIQPPVEKDWS
jgi:hypothetical protein